MRWIILATLLLATAGGAAVLAVRVYQAPGPLARAINVVVPRGNSDEIADALLHAGLIRSRLAFKAAAFATTPQGPMHAAELGFPAGASLAAVLDVLRFGRPVQHHITIPEGLTAAQISVLLAGANDLSGDVTVPDEGSVLPDTYAYTLGTPRANIITRAQSAMQHLLTTAWRARAPGLPLRSPRQALVLASIVEREAKLPVERAMIARVFLNRLGLSMRLQADPTSLYSVSGGTLSLDRKLTHADLADTDPYNTYVVEGLPVGPICSPGSASILATLHPADGDALYFVADGTGGHVFAASLAAHNANVTRFRNRAR
jgi:UPF0755 protein